MQLGDNPIEEFTPNSLLLFTQRWLPEKKQFDEPVQVIFAGTSVEELRNYIATTVAGASASELEIAKYNKYNRSWQTLHTEKESNTQKEPREEIEIQKIDRAPRDLETSKKSSKAGLRGKPWIFKDGGACYNMIYVHVGRRCGRLCRQSRWPARYNQMPTNEERKKGVG